MNNHLKNIIWGNNFFVNGQFAFGLVLMATNYFFGKVKLETVFAYANAIKSQRKIKLYREVREEVENIIELERRIKEKEIAPNDTAIINFVIDSPIERFAKRCLLQE